MEGRLLSEVGQPGPFVDGAPARRREWRTSLALLVLGLLFLVPGLLMLEYGARNAYEYDWRLSRDPVRTTARATDFRTMESTTANDSTTQSWQLRYEFRVKGDDELHTATDRSWTMSGENIWVEVPEHVWEASRDSGEIAVEYLRDEPDVNQPTKARRGSLRSIMFGIGGIAMAAIGLLLVRGALRPRPPR